MRNAAGTSEPPYTGAYRLRRGERGSAVLLVLILAMIMAQLVADNGLVLHRLNQEIKLIEKKQAKKYQTPAQPKPAPTPDKAR